MVYTTSILTQNGSNIFSNEIMRSLCDPEWVEYLSSIIYFIFKILVKPILYQIVLFYLKSIFKFYF